MLRYSDVCLPGGTVESSAHLDRRGKGDNHKRLMQKKASIVFLFAAVKILRAFFVQTSET